MATVIEPRPLADRVEDDLIRLDEDYIRVYGPDRSAWSKGVRGELIEMQRSRRTMDREAAPLHPRRPSASRRRRHCKQLAWRIHQIAPTAVTVLLNPFWSDANGPSERVFVATARGADGNRISLPRGGSRQLAALMQGAYPNADWDRTQTWRADTNQLTTWHARRYAS